MRQLLRCIAVMCILVCLSACSAPQQEFSALDLSEFIYAGIADSGEDITTNDNTQRFQAIYGMNSLLNHYFYWEESSRTVQINFYFDQGVTRSEVDAARQFVLTNLYIGDLGLWEAGIYEDWLFVGRERREIDNVYCMIYIGDDLILQDIYQGETLSHFENPQVYLAIRHCQSEYANSLTDFIHDTLGSQANVRYQASLLGTVLLIQIETPATVSGDALPAIKKYIEAEFSDLAFQDGQSLNEGKYPILVLLFFRPDGLYYQEAYLNITGQKQWLAESWMNYSLSDASY